VKEKFAGRVCLKEEEKLLERELEWRSIVVDGNVQLYLFACSGAAEVPPPLH